MLIYLVPAFYKEVDKNVSELTIFANCYKSFCYGYLQGFCGGGGGQRGESIPHKSYVNLVSWKINPIQLFPYLLSDPLVIKRDSLRRLPVCQFLYW